MKKFFKGVSIVFGTVVVLGIGGCIATMGSNEETTTTQEVKPVVKEVKKETPVVKETPKKEEPKKEPVKKEPSIPAEHQNALNTGYSYLDYTSFSHDGLAKQLAYEKYSQEAINYAMTEIDKTTDWNEQAAKKAQEYLDYSSFSKQGLIEQLKYEGFTNDQANYGANQVYK